MGGYVRWLGSSCGSGKKVGEVGQEGLFWFGLKGSKSNTISKKVSDKGGYRAARAAKNRRQNEGSLNTPGTCFQ